MKTLHKKTIIALKISVFFIAISILYTSCSKDFLDRPTQGVYTEGNYPFVSGTGPYDPIIFEAYNGLRAYGVSAIPFVDAVSVRGDDADKGSTPADGPSSKAFDDFTMTSSTGLINGMWVDHYNLINKCNLVLDTIKKDKNPLSSPAIKLSGQAEARFIRAYAYFMMVRHFGRIPLIDSIPNNEAASTNVPQSTPAQIYTFIESDLQFAANNLPTSWDTKYIGRATRGAANGLLTKVYLTQKKWSLAQSTAKLVMNSGEYDLKTKYGEIFTEAGENSSESIFEIQATVTATETGGKYGVQYASDQGVRGLELGNQWNLGIGFNSPSTILEAAYEPGDPRKARTILYSPGTTYYGETLGTVTNMPPRFNHKVLTNPSYRARYRNNFGYWMNVRVLRYADVVLMYAEASTEIGGADNIDSARKYVNLVRERARNGNNTILPNITAPDQNTMRDAVRHERRIELAMEHERFYDLVRWDTAKDVLHAAGKTNFTKGRDELLPIPQTQIDISKNVLTQNFGF